jgi:hypothetical protein
MDPALMPCGHDLVGVPQPLFEVNLLSSSPVKWWRRHFGFSAWRLASLLMLPLCLHAHAESTPEALRKFYFHHFKTEAGLSNGLINDMQRDCRGLLWLGTYNGLNCFDGSHFRSWKADPFNPARNSGTTSSSTKSRARK